MMRVGILSWTVCRGLTHRPPFSKNLYDQTRFRNDESYEEDQGNQLVQDVKSNILIWFVQTFAEVACPAESRIKCNVPGSDEQGNGGEEDESE